MIASVVFFALLGALICDAAVLPYYPGVELGSWVSPSLLLSLREEAKDVLRADAGQRLSSAARRLRTEVEVLHAVAEAQDETPQPEASTVVDDAKRYEAEGVKARVAALTSLASKLEGRLQEIDASTAALSLPSAVNWATSRVVTDASGSASSSMTWTVIDADSIAKFRKGDHTSVNAQIQESLERSATLQGTVQDVQQSLQRAYNSDADITSTLIILADVQFEQVKRLAPMRFDPVKLLRAWNDMFPSDAVPDPTLDADAFREMVRSQVAAPPTNPDNSAFIVTEVRMGAGVVGVVHSRRASNNNVARPGFRSNAEESLFVPQTLDDLLGTTEFTRDAAARLLDATLGGQVPDLRFDIICSGCTTSFHSQYKQMAVQAASQVDPSSFAAKLPGPSNHKRWMALHMAQQSNAKTVIDGILSSATEATATPSRDSIQWFLDCMTNAVNPVGGSTKGIVTGFDVTEVRKSDVLKSNTKLGGVARSSRR